MDQPVKEKKDKIDKYEVQNAVDTLIRAEEIKHNEPLMKLVRPELAKKKKAVTSISELRSRASNFSDEEDDIDDEDEPA